MCSAGLPDGVSKDSATLVLIVNIFFPGIGTMIASCLGNGGAIGIGIAQLITSWIIVGWVWAIIWSVNLIKKTDEVAPAHNAGAPLPPKGGAPPQQPPQQYAAPPPAYNGGGAPPPPGGMPPPPGGMPPPPGGVPPPAPAYTGTPPHAPPPPKAPY